MTPPSARVPDTATTFTPSDAAHRTGLTVDTLRYYEREGLTRPVNRTVGRHRRDSNNDLAWIGLLTCLRDAGLGIADLRRFTELLRNQDPPVVDRVQFLQGRRTELIEHLEATRRALRVLDDKIDHFSAASASSGSPGDG